MSPRAKTSYRAVGQTYAFLVIVERAAPCILFRASTAAAMRV
jgi:hypothetical protein